MLKLGVNIDHVATLRQARYRGEEELRPEPHPVPLAHRCVKSGAHSITVHLREDRRHIQTRDVFELKRSLEVPMNLEMAVTPEMIDFASGLKPEEACLVPENRQEVTTEGGLSVVGHEKKIGECLSRLFDAGIHASVFIDANPEQIRAAAGVGAKCIELHTGRYANAKPGDGRDMVLKELEECARLANQLGMRVNAGHGLHYDNLKVFLQRVPHLDTLNIGHSIISRSLTVGIESAVREMLDLMKGYHG